MMVYHHFHILSHRKRAKKESHHRGITRMGLDPRKVTRQLPQVDMKKTCHWRPATTGGKWGYHGLQNCQVPLGMPWIFRTWKDVNSSGVHDGISDPIQGGLDPRARVTVMMLGWYRKIINLQNASDWCMIRIEGRMPLPCLCALRMVLDCR